MNIVFMGTPEFALPTLRKIYNSSHSIISVVTQPDRPKGRGQKKVASPIKNFAIENNIPLLQPENVNAENFIQFLLKSAQIISLWLLSDRYSTKPYSKFPNSFALIYILLSYQNIGGLLLLTVPSLMEMPARGLLP